MQDRQPRVDIAGALGNWSAGEGPLYRKLAGAIRAAIRRGDLPHGLRLPAERGFALQLAVGRNTVMAAYELLREDGWLRSRQGSGTYVEAPSPVGLGDGGDPVASLRGNAFLREGALATVDLATAALPAAEEVTGAIRDLAGTPPEDLLGGTGYAPAGLPELRAALARHLTASGVPTRPEEVLVTTGDQQAISLLATHYLRPTDTVVVEDPTSPGALDAFRGTGATLRAVTAGGDGVEPLEELVTRTVPRLVYVIPTCNPAGAVLPAAARTRIADLAGRLQVPVIEDTSHADLTFGAVPLPVAAARPDAPVIMIGSMSKAFWGGLRIGWLRAPAPLVERLARVKAAADLGTPLLSQVLATRLLPLATGVAARRSALLAGRLDMVIDLLAAELPAWRPQRPSGGLTLWVRLPQPSARDFSHIALRHGVAVLPGPLLSAQERFDDHLRLAFGLDEAAAREGVHRLARAWAAYTALPHGDTGTVPVVV